MADFESEAELQKLLIEALDKGILPSIVDDKAELQTLAAESSDTQFPLFSLDHMVRLAAIREGALVLDALSLLKVLIDDENVSVTSGDILRPDIVCINPETESIVL